MKKITYGLVLSAILVIAGSAFVGTVSAYKGDPTVMGPNYSPERHAAMEKAFSSNDYDSWKSLVNERGRAAQVVNRDNFAKFADAHKLAEQGRFDEAKKIRESMGLGMRDGSGAGRGGCQGRGRMGNAANATR